MRSDQNDGAESGFQTGSYFTLSEANEQVVAVRRRFDVIMQLRTQAKKLHDRLEVHGYPAMVDDDAQVRLASSDGVDLDMEPPPPTVLRWAGMLRAVYAAMHEEIATVQESGCVIRDLDSGFVDWPALHGDREIWLSWKYGEIEIAHWHDSQAHTSAYRPLSELEAEEA